MEKPTLGTVLVLLGGEPLLAEQRAAGSARMGLVDRFLGAGVVFLRPAGPSRVPGDRTVPTEDVMFPTDQLMCAQEVIDAARKAGKHVQLADVNAPTAEGTPDTSLLGPDDLLPVALRADGQRLVGLDAFDRGAIARFVAGA